MFLLLSWYFTASWPDAPALGSWLLGESTKIWRNDINFRYWRITSSPADWTREESWPAVDTHDVTRVTLVHLSRHSVPAHRALQTVLDAPGQSLALTLVPSPGHTAQPRGDEVLHGLSLGHIIRSSQMISSYKQNYKLEILPGCVKQTLWKDWALFILLNPNLILIISCPQVELLMIVWRICGHCDAWDVAVIVVEERSGDQNCRNNKHLDFYQCKFWYRFCNR